MNGIKSSIAIQEFWKENLLKGCSIIACSAFDSGEIKEECFRAGIKDYVSKPLNYKKLKSVVQQYLN